VIDWNEPKDGDFVTYVEKLVKLPAGMRLASNDASPGEVGRGRPVRQRLVDRVRPASEPAQAGASGTEPVTARKLAETAGGGAQAWGRSVDSVFGTAERLSQRADAGDGAHALGRSTARAAARREATLDTEQVARFLAKWIGRVGNFMILVGIALVAVSFAERPLFDVDPGIGMVATVVGAVLRRIAGKVS
jgi:hypothetical protein